MSAAARLGSRVAELVGHPRSAMALKSAVAATVAWAVALPLPGAAADYAFYAPFDAVVTMYPAVMRSSAAAARGVGAIMLGAVVGCTWGRRCSGTVPLRSRSS